MQTWRAQLKVPMTALALELLFGACASVNSSINPTLAPYTSQESGLTSLTFHHPIKQVWDAVHFALNDYEIEKQDLAGGHALTTWQERGADPSKVVFKKNFDPSETYKRAPATVSKDRGALRTRLMVTVAQEPQSPEHVTVMVTREVQAYNRQNEAFEPAETDGIEETAFLNNVYWALERSNQPIAPEAAPVTATTEKTADPSRKPASPSASTENTLSSDPEDNPL